METKIQDAGQIFRQQIVDRFFRDGRLQALPAKKKKRLIVLEEILKRFEFDRIYAEKEVNLVITEVFDDYCTIRREMVDERMMGRNQDGYWRIKAE